MSGDRPYDNSEALDREGMPDVEDSINQDEGMMPPGDQPAAADEFGVTAAEARGDEPVAERASRERPEVAPDDVNLEAADREYGEPSEGDPVYGRLTEPGSEDVDTTDDEKDAVGQLVGEDDGALSAEEAALHITDQP